MATRTCRKRKSVDPKVRRERNLAARYGMTQQDFAERMESQGNLCALCGCPMERPVVDHDHSTGAVRGILCHPCNIKLPAIEDAGWVMLAWAYLVGDAD